jgi:hypothetical protein
LEIDTSGLPANWGTWAAVPSIFGVVWGLFASFEAKAMSPDAKRDLAAVLIDTDFVAAARKIPGLVNSTFISVFGSRQFSAKCLVTSFCLSCLSIATLLIFGFIFNYRYFYTMPSEFYHRTSFRFLYIGSITVWILVDFLNIYKSRLVLSKFLRFKRSIFAAGLFIFADFLVGLLIFISTYEFINYVLLMHGLLQFMYQNASPSYNGPTVRGSITELFFFVVQNTHIYLANYPKDAFRWLRMILNGPIANEVAVLFYASLLPTVWIWLFYVSVLISRAVRRINPVIELTRYTLDVREHPLRSVGVVAAALCTAIYGFILWTAPYFLNSNYLAATSD